LNYTYTSSKGLIVAIVPQYNQYGSFYKVFYENGETEESQNQITFILKQYLSHWRKSLSRLIGKSENTTTIGTVPFAITYKHTFIPLMVRSAQINGDPVYGLFWHEKIDYTSQISRTPAKSIVCNKIEFEVKTTYSTLRDKRNLADEAQLRWQKLNGHADPRKTLLDEFYNSFVQCNASAVKLMEHSEAFRTGW